MISAGLTRQAMFGKTYVFSYGGRVVLNIDRINRDKLSLVNMPSGNRTALNPEVDLGAEIKNQRLNIGLSLKNLIGSATKENGSAILENRREGILNASYVLGFFGRNFRFGPIAQLYYERKAFVDGGVFIGLFKKLNLTYIMRINELRSIAGAEWIASDKLSIAAAFDGAELTSDNNLDLMIRFRF